MTDMTTDSELPVIGVLGFGKVGTVLARLAQQAGYRVLAAASGDPVRIRMTRDALAPGVEIAWANEVAAAADILILALPLYAHGDLPVHLLDGTIVVDAANHWPEVDGPREDWVPNEASTSEFLQAQMPAARVVKAFNHIGYHDLEPRKYPVDDPRRVAVAVAGDDPDASRAVSALVQRMGFQPVDIGPLARGRMLEPGSRTFGAAVPEADLRRMLEATDSS